MKYLGCHQNQSGIYRITNTITGRYYIGSSSHFKRRYNQHKSLLLNNKHSNSFLQNDFNKCGADNFVFEEIEMVEGDKEVRLKREQYFLDRLHDGQIQCYNIDVVACSAEGRIFSKTMEHSKVLLSTKAKLRWSDEAFREKMLMAFANGDKYSWNKGKKCPQISEGKSGSNHPMFGLHLTSEQKEKQEKSHTRFMKPVIQLTLEGHVVAEFPSVKAAMRSTGLKGIFDCLSGRQKTRGGFIWKYKN